MSNRRYCSSMKSWRLATPNFDIAVRSESKKLQRQGTTIVFVSHNLYSVKSICDRAIFIAEGRVKANGDVGIVITTYEKWIHETQIRDSPLNEADAPYLQRENAVDIVGVEIRDRSDPKADILAHSDPVDVTVEFFAKERIRSPNLVLQIVRPTGPRAV